MRDLKQFLMAYEKDHQNPVNKIIHFICVPAIVVCTVGIFWGASDWLYGDRISGQAMLWLNLGSIGVLASWLFYARLSGLLLAIMVVFGAATIAGLALIYNSVGGTALLIGSAAIWVAAWIGQFIGHEIEGAKPSFTDDLVFLLIGPAFVVEKIFRRFGSSLVAGR